MMKKIYTTLIVLVATLTASAQGWPANYGGVMLQGFYWDGYDDAQWTVLESQADELSQYFKLVWIPQSGNCGTKSMGYDDLYWFPGGNNYKSSFGTEAELRSMIKTFKNKGIGTIADVVINHRRNVSNWVDFPKETYKGVTYQLNSTDIVSNDDGGATKTWANSNGYSLSSNADTGEGWDGMRDLDHKSTNVQTNVKAYLKMLLEDLGYVGFRYDMVKGYAGSYTKIYNEDAKPQFSVGECWDGTTTIKNWIDATGKTSAAFDFQFRYTVRNAINTGNWGRLGNQNDNNWPLVSNNYENGNYFQYAVTFVENHDTEKRSNAEQDPIRKDTLAANAYLLAMPGTPCVFLTHWMAYKQEIKAMIDARKAAGITNTSSYENMRSSYGLYANLIKVNDKNRLIVTVGSDLSGYTPSSADWTKVLEGYHYAYYLANSLETAWADKASGEYSDPFSVKLTAVSATSGAQLVYTLDGSNPTASSTKANSGTSITINEACTLKVGLLKNGTVTSIITREYSFKAPYEPKTITVHVDVSKVNWSNVNFWTWGGDGSHAPTNSNWPGDRVTATKTVNDKTWYYKSFTLNSDDDLVNFVFSTNSGSPQTVDINNVTTDKYFEISTTQTDGKYTVNDVTETVTGINEIESTTPNYNNKVYTIDGRVVRDHYDFNTLPHGIYIYKGKKIVK